MSILCALVLSACAIESESTESADQSATETERTCYRIGETAEGQQYANMHVFAEQLVNHIAPSMLKCAVEPAQVRDTTEFGDQARVVSQRFESISPQVVFPGGGASPFLRFDPVDWQVGWKPVAASNRFWRRWLERFDGVMREWKLPNAPDFIFELVHDQTNVLLLVRDPNVSSSQQSVVAAYADCGVNPSTPGCACRAGGVSPVSLHEFPNYIGPRPAIDLSEAPFSIMRVVPGIMMGLTDKTIAENLGISTAVVNTNVQGLSDTIGVQNREQLVMRLWGMEFDTEHDLEVTLHDRSVTLKADELSFLMEASSANGEIVEEGTIPNTTLSRNIQRHKARLNLPSRSSRATLLAAIYLGTVHPDGVCSPVETIPKPTQACFPLGMRWVGEQGYRNADDDDHIIQFRRKLLELVHPAVLGCARGNTYTTSEGWLRQSFGSFSVETIPRDRDQVRFAAVGIRNLGVRFARDLISNKIGAQKMSQLGPFAFTETYWKSGLDRAMFTGFSLGTRTSRFRGLGHDVLFLSSVGYSDCAYNPWSPGCDGRTEGIGMIPTSTLWEDTKSRAQYYLSRLFGKARDVAYLSLTGKKVEDVANILASSGWWDQEVTPETVRSTHLFHIYDQLGVRTRSELLALMWGIDFDHVSPGATYDIGRRTYELTEKRLFVLRKFALGLTGDMIDQLPEAEAVLHGQPAHDVLSGIRARFPTDMTAAQIIDYIYLATGGASHWPRVVTDHRPAWLDEL